MTRGDVVEGLLLCVGGYVLVGISLHEALSAPTAYVRWVDGQCVEVVNADGSAGDCSRLPERYENVWVE